MIVITAVLLGSDNAHAYSLARNVMAVCGGYLTTLVDDNRVYCSLLCDEPEIHDADEKSVVVNRLMAEISVQDKFEEKLKTLGCPFTFVEDSDTDEKLTLEDMKACDGANELLTEVYNLETLRSMLSSHGETLKYAKAIDAVLPYVKKAIFAKVVNLK